MTEYKLGIIIFVLGMGPSLDLKYHTLFIYIIV